MNSLKMILIGLFILYLICGLFLYFLQEKIIFCPEALDQNFSFPFESPHEEHFIKTQDDGLIHALHFKSSDSKGLIIYFHGTEDATVPYSSKKRLFESLSGQQKIITIAGGEHNNLSNYDLYWEEMKKALAK